jgi:predicted DNA-binding protein
MQKMMINKVQKLARQLSKSEESIRFSVTLTQSDNSRLENFADIKGKSKSAFCSELLSAALDDFEEVLTSPDETMNDLNLPSAQDYARAFHAIVDKLTAGHKAILKAHYHAPKYTAKASELATAAGYQDYRGYNRQSARIGQMLADNLGVSLPLREDGTLFPSAFLVQWTKSEDIWYSTLHPQVANAIEIVGLNK